MQNKIMNCLRLLLKATFLCNFHMSADIRKPSLQGRTRNVKKMCSEWNWQTTRQSLSDMLTDEIKDRKQDGFSAFPLCFLGFKPDRRSFCWVHLHAVRKNDSTNTVISPASPVTAPFSLPSLFSVRIWKVCPVEHFSQAYSEKFFYPKETNLLWH